MKRTRRGFLGAVTALAAAVAVAPVVKAEASCADCERVFATAFTVPDAFDKQQAPGYVEMARRAVHELAIREGISHDEAGVREWWNAFPTIVESRALTFEQMQADCEARGCVLDQQYSIVHLATEVVHLATEVVHQPAHAVGVSIPDRLLIERYASNNGDARVDAWRQSLHTE
jgi:hypothetical protein